jgi:hypothetical protein
MRNKKSTPLTDNQYLRLELLLSQRPPRVKAFKVTGILSSKQVVKIMCILAFSLILWLSIVSIIKNQ